MSRNVGYLMRRIGLPPNTARGELRVSPARIVTAVLPPVLRLAITSRCNFECHFPSAPLITWCHREGSKGNGPDACTEDVLGLAMLIRDIFGFEIARIAGLEASLHPRLAEIVSGLRDVGFRDISLTTNGSTISHNMERLRDAGLTGLSVSIPNFNRRRYFQITGVDCLEQVISGVLKAQEMGLEVRVNRLLLNGSQADLPAFLDWAIETGLHVRLYELFWHPGIDGAFSKYYVSPYRYLPLWRSRYKRLEISRYELPARERWTFQIADGASITTDKFLPKPTTGVCAHCEMRRRCREGLFGCGLRIGTDCCLVPCLLRPDLRIDYSDVVELETSDVCDGSSSLFAKLAELSPLLSSCTGDSMLTQVV